MPKLIWWDILEWKTSSKIVLSIAESLASFFCKISDVDHWWGFISNYEILDEKNRQALREHLIKNGIFEAFENGLHDFIVLFPSCPLNKILSKDISCLYESAFLDKFKNRMTILYDRKSVNAINMQSRLILMGFLLKRLRVKEGLILSDFLEISKYPNTSKSRQLASSICALLNGIGPLQLPEYQKDKWISYFWNRGNELDPVDFSYLGRI